MTKLQRPLTLCFQTTRVGRLTEEDTLNELRKHVRAEDIKCIQLTANEGRITLFDENTKNQLAIKTVNIKGNPVKFQNPDSDITNATIKDAPIELTDDTVIAALSNFGHIVPQSMRRGKIRGTNILPGTRYVQINDVVNTIPTEIEVGEFQIRVFCDNGKTECKHCGDTSHPSYRCPLRPGQTKRCFRCYSTSHLVDKCQNEVVCNHCGQPGHRQKECDAKKEIEQYGDYRYEIAEGRESANLEATSSQIKMKKTAPTEEKTDVLITVAADLVEPTKPTPIPVIVSGNIVTNSTRSNKNNENNSESGPSSSSPSRNKNNKDVKIRRSDSNDNSTAKAPMLTSVVATTISPIIC